MPVFALSAAGFIVGLLVGLTGVGGGVLMTPLLIFSFGLPPTAAVSTDLAYGAITKICGAWQHTRQGTVEWPVVRRLALGSIPGSIVAVAILARLRHIEPAFAEVWVARALGLALVAAAVTLVHGLFVAQRRPRRTVRGARLIAVGAVVGVLVGWTSIGSGSVVLALLVVLTPLSPQQLVGTDIAHAAVLASAATAGHAFTGHIDPTMVAALVAGSIPGVIIGSRQTTWAPRTVLQMGLVGVLVASGLRLIAR